MQNQKRWYVMRDLRRSNAKNSAYRQLVQRGVEVFTPMTVARSKRGAGKELVPLLHWLLFVHATKAEIDALISPSAPQIPMLQYSYERGKSASRDGGLVVDDSAMTYFQIAVTKQSLPVVYGYHDITPAMRGRRVIVTRGDLMGYIGHIKKYTGGRNMKLFVELENYCFAAIQISPKDIRFLDDTESAMTPDEERDYYMRIVRMVDIVNFLRFSVARDIGICTDAALAEQHAVYSQAKRVLDAHRVKEYLCVDEVCTTRLSEIEREVKRRNLDLGTVDLTQSALLARLRELCARIK